MVMNSRGFKGFRAPRDKRLRASRETSKVYPQGIKGTIFSLSVLDYEQSYYTYT